MSPGPIPQRSDSLAQARKADRGDVTKGESLPATIPEADPTWHPIAKMFYASLQESGQSEFYQSSDWFLAYSIAEDLSRYKEPLVNRETGELYFKRSGQMLQTIYSAMSDLLVSEAARRRVRIELEAPEEETTPAEVTAIEGYKRRMGLVE